MKISIKTISSLALAATLALPVAAMAHPSSNGEHAEPIHVVEDSYTSCFFDLHSLKKLVPSRAFTKTVVRRLLVAAILT